MARVPAPKATHADPARALIFDSYYDEYRGVIAFFRVLDGVITKKDTACFMNTGKDYDITELGCLSPYQTQVNQLEVGKRDAGRENPP